MSHSSSEVAHVNVVISKSANGRILARGCLTLGGYIQASIVITIIILVVTIVHKMSCKFRGSQEVACGTMVERGDEVCATNDVVRVHKAERCVVGITGIDELKARETAVLEAREVR